MFLPATEFYVLDQVFCFVAGYWGFEVIQCCHLLGQHLLLCFLLLLQKGISALPYSYRLGCWFDLMELRPEITPSFECVEQIFLLFMSDFVHFQTILGGEPKRDVISHQLYYYEHYYNPYLFRLL